MESKTPIEWLRELSTCHCTRWYEHDREQAEALIAEIILFTAERDRYKAERDGLVTLCKTILKIMERNNDQFRSDTRGWAYGHLFAAINKIKEG